MNLLGCFRPGGRVTPLSPSEAHPRLTCMRDLYELSRSLGHGAKSEVILGRCRRTGSFYALKFFSLGDGKDDKIERGIINELQIGTQLGEGHVSIARCHEVLFTSTKVCVISEFCSQGTLNDYLKKHHPVSEAFASYLIRQIASALAYCHGQGVAYRDVKMVNIMLDGRDPLVVKLIDFGVSRRSTRRDMDSYPSLTQLRTFTGTPGYLSPQVLEVGLLQSGFVRSSAPTSSDSAISPRSPRASGGRGSDHAGTGGPPTRGSDGPSPHSPTARTGSRSHPPDPADCPPGSPAAQSTTPRSSLLDLSAGPPLQDSYDGPKADVWALGVVLVRIMLNKNPWRVDPKLIRDRPLEAHRRSLEEQRTGAPWFERLEEGSPSRAQFENFSPGLKDLLERMLDKDEDRRISMTEVLEHPWVRQALPEALEARLEGLRAAQAAREAQREVYSARAGDEAIAAFVKEALERASCRPRRSAGAVEDDQIVANFVLGRERAVSHRRPPEHSFSSPLPSTAADQRLHASLHCRATSAVGGLARSDGAVAPVGAAASAPGDAGASWVPMPTAAARAVAWHPDVADRGAAQYPAKGGPRELKDTFMDNTGGPQSWEPAARFSGGGA